MERTISMDDLPLSKTHIRTAIFTTGGKFCDGYILGVIGIALTLLGPQMELSSVWYGLIGSSALIGLFLGSFFFGWLTDKIGRKPIYLVTIALFVVLSIPQFFVTSPEQLFILRLLMGIMISAEYATGATLLSELLPKKQRGTVLACLNAMWTVGFVFSVIISYAMLSFGGEEVWRWMLASSAVPAFLLFVMRLGAPESPRWLVSKGRIDEATAVVDKFFGKHVRIDDLRLEENKKTNVKELFNRNYRTRTAFAGLFWGLHVLPYFGMMTFTPIVFTSLNMEDGFFSTLISNLFQLAGAVVGVVIMDKISRRSFAIYSFFILAISIALLAIIPNPSSFIVVGCFAIYVFAASGSGNLQTVYPSEIFPTHIRSTGVGFATMISRIGAAVGTFLLPISLDVLGINITMGILAGILLLAAFISIKWAPETRNISLVEASNVATPLYNVNLREEKAR
ncbi:MFS transporter [Bacillus sp. ISL-40]|uniref:MFS transporter n=1 Tax=unclassified Bacillus (in: firmicutes) TaxID=185979 RepID=UPI001BEB4212|nr:MULTISPECIES: MFS transporter [unclassified Bacillus (in: firmicutes)]MBT2698595.1 MFS transporter [Bacillus sp. ISL-40]MBT2739179.1 MFS transporter [Bacillus sp. ISL-77]